MINRADRDPWDVFAPGYHYKLQLKKRYKIKEIIGLLFLENGNHKLAIRVYAPYFDKNLAIKEIETYFLQYTEQTSKKGFWIPINDDYVPEGMSVEIVDFSSPTVQSLHPSVMNSKPTKYHAAKGKVP